MRSAAAEPEVETDEDGRPYHVHGDGAVHYLDDEDEHSH